MPKKPDSHTCEPSLEKQSLKQQILNTSEKQVKNFICNYY